MILFQDEDAHYLNFLTVPEHRVGFVLNTTRTPSTYAALHRADCGTIQGLPTRGQRWTSGDYRKVWAATAEELTAWAAADLQATPRPCGRCRPAPRPAEAAAHGPESDPTTDASALVGEGEVVIELATEGGGETIFRRRSEEGWVYWSDGSTIDMDENEDDHFRGWHRPDMEDFFGLLPPSWPLLSPLQIHPEWRAWFRKSYGTFLMGLDEGDREDYEAFGSRARQWAALTEGVD